MGMYTGLRFKGVIKQAYREDFAKIFTPQNYEDQEYFSWINSKHDDLFSFGMNSRASLFQNSAYLPYMPWEDDGDTSFDGFNPITGELNFQCSIKNYEGEIEAFLNIIPNFTEVLHHCEVLYEEWVTGNFYELRNGCLILTVESTDDLDEYGR